MRSLTVLLVAAGAALGAGSALGQTPSADPAWDAAIALKTKSAYADAAVAFDAWAKANPDKPRFGEALTEAGVCWFNVGREKLKLLRATPESTTAFQSALEYLDRVVKLGPTPYGGRAQYMRGSTRIFMGDMVGAESEYTQVLDAWKSDAKYYPKSIERRALVRRNLLLTQGATADLERYQKEFPKGDDIESIKRYAAYCTMFEKPAPPLVPQTWIQGDPTSLSALRGEVVAVYFFASWCENCEAVRPFMLDLFDRYEALGVHIIGVFDHSKGQNVDGSKGWLAVNHVRFPVFMDTPVRVVETPAREEQGGKTASAYLCTKIPDVVLIDRSGRVRWHDNPNNLQDSTIEALLLEDPPKPVAK